MAKILVIRLSSIGDIVLASPVFRCLHQLPEAEVHFVTKLKFKMVTASNPFIQKFHYLDSGLSDLISELKNENFDYIIDLHNNLRSNKIKSELKIKSFTINKENIKKFFLTEFSLSFGKIEHITKRSLATVAHLGVKDDGKGLDYFIDEKDVTSMQDIPSSHHAGYIAFVIGASYNCKKLPVYKFKQLLQKLDHPVILIGGEKDRKEGEEIAAVDPVKIYNACGKFNLNESADLIKKSKLVVSHDTGFQYVACAFQKPVIALWGCTSPRLGFEPYYGSSNFKNNYDNIFLDLHCQPCSKGTDHCPLGHFNCMNKIDVDIILEKIYQRLSAPLF